MLIFYIWRQLLEGCTTYPKPCRDPSKFLAPERRHTCSSTRGPTSIRCQGTKCSRHRHLAAGISAPLDKFIEINVNPGKIKIYCQANASTGITLQLGTASRCMCVQYLVADNRQWAILQLRDWAE